MRFSAFALEHMSPLACDLVLLRVLLALSGLLANVQDRLGELHVELVWVCKGRCCPRLNFSLASHGFSSMP